MKRALLFFTFLAIAGASAAQQTGWHIIGRVMNEAGEALPGATVLAGESAQSVSDSAGRFGLFLKTLPQEIQVRRLGYFPQRIRPDTLRWEDRRGSVRIVLTPHSTSLSEVTISTKPIESIFKETYSSSLLDYVFAGQQLLLLVREKKKHYLRLTTDDGRVISELLLPDNTAAKLHRSCTGAFHVCGSQWAWEVTLAGGRVDTFSRYPAAGFYGLVLPCAAQKDGYYFFRKMGPFNQSVRYFYFDPAGNGRQLIEIVDSLANLAAWDMYSDLVTRKLFMLPRTYETSPGNPFGAKHPDFVIEDLPFARFGGEKALGPEGLMQRLTVFNDDQPAYLSALEALRGDSVYAPMYAIGDTVFLFNHVDNTLLRINTNPWQLGFCPLTFHRSDGWRKEVIVDEALQRVYGRFFTSDTGLVLKEIDLQTGRSAKTYRVPLAPYLATNYRIRNGLLYFIGQPDANMPNRQLYKVHIYKFLTAENEGK
ncbi:MAG: carboxypeptidase regulatory-like domain-containing protein [Saprospiraceae bacterium]|nr:carboxypeptidase regulatory-like domain-containing protein [Saprospiraceae bacterium]